ncbi:MAG: DUF2029 domain-containing protein [Planctomycetes bacterium]|nr:DUF2029 domain-containing protein [Planctomycetota bacterium]
MVGILLAFAFHAIAFGSWQGFHGGIDHNREPFEDFMGPYLRQVQALWRGEGIQEGYLYPPTLAILLQPLACLTPGQASWVWLAVLALASLALFWVGLQWVGRGRTPVACAYSLVFSLSFPWLHDLHWGQVSTVVWALTLIGLYAWSIGKDGLGCMALSLAIAIKLYPAWFLLVPILQGKRRTVVRVLGLVIGWMWVLPVLYLGHEATWEFYAELSSRLTARGPARFLSGEFWGPRMSQFLPAVLSRAWGGAQGLWLGLAWLLPLAFLGFILRAAGRRIRGGDPLMGAAMLACALPLIVSPSWIHYFVWLPWASFAVWGSCQGRLSKSLTTLAMVLGGTPFFFVVGGNPAYGLCAFPAVASLLLVLAELSSGPHCYGWIGSRSVLLEAGDGPLDPSPLSGSAPEGVCGL